MAGDRRVPRDRCGGGRLPRSLQLVDDVVNERVVRVTPPAHLLSPAGPSSRSPTAQRGTARAIRTRAGNRVLTLTDFEVGQRPRPARLPRRGSRSQRGRGEEFEDLGALKGNKGDQQYALPRGLDLSDYSTVVIWCRAFSVNFARAPLT